MQPPLAPLDRGRSRALTSIYAPKSLRGRRRVPAAAAMLDNDIHIKPTLSPFHPLPAIGQTLQKSATKVILFDLHHNKRPSTIEDLPSVKSMKVHDYLKPLTPLQVHGLARKNSLEDRKQQHLLRENTYDVIEPIYLKATKLKKRDLVARHLEKPIQLEAPKDYEMTEVSDKVKESPKTRFKKAAMQVAQLSTPETGKLLCLRERLTLKVCFEDEQDCKLQELPCSPSQKLDKLSEIFQHLDLTSRHRDKMKKENSWF